MENSRKKVLVGMSGGVDSSVSAALLLQQGYEVIGAFMKNWSEGCGWKQERRDAQRVAAKLGIPFLTFDFEESYRQLVVEEMFEEYVAGRTPNPDILCNKFIKFDRFVKAADELGCDFVATGHYARTISCHPEEARSADDGSRVCLAKAADPNKDQTYFLWAINREVLRRVLFPIGYLTKPDVRAKARELGLEVAEKKDSIGICFVGEVAMREFLSARISDDPGDVITVDGKIIGQHTGINFYTIGQRHGLSIGGGTPYYVVEKRPETKELVVSSNYHPSLYKKNLTARQINLLTSFHDMDDHIALVRSEESKPSVWLSTRSLAHREFLSTSIRCQARIRHRQPLQDCVVKFDGETAHVKFDEPQRAITPGQSIVLYQEEVVLGGGIIQ